MSKKALYLVEEVVDDDVVICYVLSGVRIYIYPVKMAELGGNAILAVASDSVGRTLNIVGIGGNERLQLVDVAFAVSEFFEILYPILHQDRHNAIFPE